MKGYGVVENVWLLQEFPHPLLQGVVHGALDRFFGEDVSHVLYLTFSTKDMQPRLISNNQ